MQEDDLLMTQKKTKQSFWSDPVKDRLIEMFGMTFNRPFMLKNPPVCLN